MLELLLPISDLVQRFRVKGPIVVTLRPQLFYLLARGDDQGDVLLRYHTPVVLEGVHSRALTSYELAISD